MQSEENRRRDELTEKLKEVVNGWAKFAEEYHGKEYADGEHAYGVMNIEYTEALNRVEAVGNVIRDFKENQVMNHKYHDTRKQMAALYDHALFAAEEAVQIAAVAMKAIGSAFVYNAEDGE